MGNAEIFQGRIGIIGAGAIGCYYGARLARAGHDVHFLMRRDYEIVRERGLKVISINGDFEIRPAVYASAQALGRCDLIIIGLKSTDNRALPALLGPTCGPRTLVLTLQNGLGIDDELARVMAELAGDPEAGGRALGGAAFICSTRRAPGVVHHTAEGWLRIGERQGPPQARTRAIAALFRSGGVDCETVQSLTQLRWEKLIWNVAFNGLGVAAIRADTAVILADPTLTATARGLMEEVIAAARADGLTIDPAIVERRMRTTATMGAYKSSMQIDDENGRPLEVEAILGEPLRRAQRAGIAVPRLEMLYGIVKRASTRPTATGA